MFWHPSCDGFQSSKDEREWKVQGNELEKDMERNKLYYKK